MQNHSFPPFKTLKHRQQTCQVASYRRTADPCEVKDILSVGKVCAEQEQNSRATAASWQGGSAILRKRDLVPDTAEWRGAWFAMLNKGQCRSNPSLLILLVIQGSFVQCLEETRGSANRVCCCSSCDVRESSQNEQHMFGFTKVQQNSIQSTQNIWE